MQMDQYLKDRNHLAVIFLLVVGFLYVIFGWTLTGTNLLLSIQDQMLRSRNNVTKRMSEQKKDELEQVLKETATANKTVIITIVNKAYVEGDKPMLDLFLDSFWLGDNTRPLLDHLLLVATDETSYERCKLLRLHCYKIQIQQHGEEQDQEHVFMTPGFINMMWRRTQFIGDVLKRGYNFIFTDTDIMWLRDPFPRLSAEDEGLDLQISNDGFNGDGWSEANAINTGFFMIRSNKNTIKLVDMWYDRRNTSKGMKEQDVLRRMIGEGVLRKIGVKVRFLDTLFFSGFCNDSRDVRLVCTVHANCCRYIKAKVTDLQQVLHDWKRFLSLPHRNSTKTAARFRWSKHVACVNSWKIN